ILARNLPFTTLTGIIIALLAAAGAARAIDHLWLAGWAAAFVIIAVLRLAMVRLYWRSPHRDRDVRFWGAVLAFNTLLSGLMWLVFGLIAFAPDDASHVLFVAIIQTSLTAASLASLSAFTPAQLAFAIPTMAGLIVPFANSGERSLMILAGMALVFVAVIFLSSRSAERVLAQSIRLRFDNQRLIDELRESEANLRRATVEANAASRAKSDFLAMMSHEIRTPMNGVVAMAELLAQTSLDSEQRGMLAIMRNSGESLLSIIEDILDFSKIEAGRLTIERIPLDLRGIVEAVAETVAPRACEAGLEVVVDVDAGLPARVLGDPGRLRQILLNLAGNAVKFTERGHVRIAAEAAGDQIAFVIEDTGMGITPEALARLFQPFTQADGAVARRYGGTGLGLSICKRLIDLMGGTIRVDSAPESGTRFRFTLPLPAAEPTAKPGPMPLAAAAVAVLAAAPLRQAIERMVTASGATVTEDTAAADVVICEEGQRPAEAARVVALTAFDHMEVRAPAVRKPVRSRELVEAVAAILGRTQVLPPPTRLATTAYAAPARLAAEREGATILVAEDNRVNRLVISKMLDRLGMVY
ncbi:MAG: hypothetical protein K2Q10_04345, partial [Rhodospirillales bacterium]|nr:hypothetical protein [Rhodospirillales bacterium]